MARFGASYNSCVTDGDRFHKNYHQLPVSEWIRIRDGALFLSDTGLGPKVHQIDNSCFRLTFQTVIPARTYLTETGTVNDIPFRKAIFKELATEAVKKMHSANWGHGDLTLDNLGVTLILGYPTIKILDPDTMYRIDQGRHEVWLIRHMRSFDLSPDQYDEFVAYDFLNWAEELDEL